MQGSVSKNMDVHFSSKKNDWETPQDFFDKYDKMYGFELDVCASEYNKKCDNYFDIEQDGLEQNWGEKICWMNPPYGREIGKWVKKAFEESKKGATVVCLLPSRTDTRWFHDYCINGDIEFIRGRLKFVGAKNAAPFPSMIVVFKGKDI